MRIKTTLFLVFAVTVTTTHAQTSTSKDRESELNKVRIQVANEQKKKLCKGLKEPAYIKEYDRNYSNIRKKLNFLSDWDFKRKVIFVDKKLWEDLSREERQLAIAPMYTYAVCFSEWKEDGPTAHVFNKDGGFNPSIDRYKPEGFREDYARLTR